MSKDVSVVRQPSGPNGTRASDDSTVAKAYQALATAIRDGEFHPNQRLVENELTERLGVSRATLRAVFTRLHQEDYIVVEHNKGARVRAFTVDEALEILQTREILEGAAAGLAAGRITDDELRHLEEILTDMRVAASDRDGARYSKLNRRFHEVVVQASRQPTLIKFIKITPYPLVMRQFRNAQTVHPRTGSLEEHQAIFSALVVRNAVAAEATMRFHVSSARRALTLAGADTAAFAE